MRKQIIIVIILGILSITNLLGQVFEPDALQFNHFTTLSATTKSLSTFNNSDNRFKYEDFVFGWHWAWGKRLSNSLQMNQAHIYDGHDNSKLFKKDLGIVLNVDGIWSEAGSLLHLNSQCLVYKPTLQINSSQIPNLQNVEITNGNKTEKYIFGFQTVVGDVSNPNYLKLNYQQYNPNILQRVLKDAWTNKGLITFRGYGNNDDPDLYINHLGSNWRLCISISKGDFENSQNEYVLRIKMPYSLKNGTAGAIIFRKLPSSIQYDTTHIYQDKNPNNQLIGIYQKLNPGVFQTNEFIITKSMLPADGSTIDIFAEFLTPPNKTGPYENPPFGDCELGVNCEDTRITQFDIQVEYLGACDIKIHNIRVCTPIAWELLWDQHISTFQDKIQTALNKFEQENPIDEEDKFWHEKQIIKRIYTRDEGGISFWAAYRYFNKLVNNIGTTECTPIYPKLYDYYVEPMERWYIFTQSYVKMGCPYIKDSEWRSYEKRNVTNEPFDNLGLGQGYMFQNKPGSSHYETYLLGSWTFADINNSPNIPSEEDYASFGDSFQRVYETHLKHAFWDFGNDKLIYMDKDWWGKFNIDARVIKYNGQPLRQIHWKSGSRPANYHETMLFCYTPLIFGARGVLLDGESTFDTNSDAHDITKDGKDGVVCLRDEVDSEFPESDTEPYDVPDGAQFINFDELGSDWIVKDVNSYSHIEDHIVWDWKDYSEKGMVDLLPRPNKFFIGQKSNRRALYEFSKFVRKNENELKNLHPRCRLSKGYYQYYSQADGLANNFMAKFVSTNISDWKSRPIGRVKSDGSKYYENKFENNLVDSTFFETTILADKINDPNMDNYFYVGLVNRRTDPIIETSPNQFDFITEPEMEELTNGQATEDRNNPAHDTQNDTQTKTVAEWRELFYKRFGNREITIPFNYKDQNNPNQYCLLHVEELLAENEPTTDQTGTPGTTPEWWRQERWNNRIDTIVGMDSDLAIKFNAGEGKVLMCSIIRPQTLEGKLDFSNQCKMVSHPVLTINGEETDEIMYHLCYQKKVKIPPNNIELEKVFYVASEPIKRNDVDSQDEINENIIWRSPIDISTNITSQFTMINESENSIKSNCVHPSLIARKDGNNVKVFVVFSIEKELSGDNDCVPCENVCTVLKNPIAEAIITYTNSTAGLPTKNVIVPRVIHSGNNENIDDIFGTPIVSASDNNVNFYAWSDAHCGIGTNYKSSSLTLFTTPNHYIKFASTISNDGVIAKHPSFNFYNKTGESITNALVWEERNQQDNFSKVIYTNIYNAVYGVDHILPNMLANLGYINNNCLRLTTIENSTKPVVISSWDVPNNESSPIYRNDQIFWESSYNFRSELATKSLRILSTPYNFDASLSSEKRIKKFSLFDPLNQDLLYQPNLSYGDSKIFNKEINYPSSSAKKFNLLNFKVKYGSFNRIMNLPLTQHSLLSANERLTARPPFMYIAEGNNSHLSKSWDYNMNTDSKMWQNRRVMESLNILTEDNKKLIPNAKYFYRDNTDDLIASSSFVGFIEPIERKFKYFIDLPKIDGNDIPINLPYEEYTDSVGYTGYVEIEMDTLYSDWFHVDNVGTLEYKVIFADTVFADLFIQKESNGQLINIPRPGDFENELCFMVYFLVNGGNDNYRLALIKYDSLLNYEERLYFGEASVVDTIFAKTAIKDRIIDLYNNSTYTSTDDFELIAYPNPATDVIYASALLPLEIIKENTEIELTYILANSIGTEIERTTASSGEIVNFKTHNLSSGAYFIKVEANTNTLNPLSKSKSIIISR